MRNLYKKKWAALLFFALLCLAVPVNIQAKNTKISLSRTSLTIKTGEKKTLRATTNASGKITWKSSDKKVVSVSQRGVLTAKKKGTATITAKAGGKTAKCRVKVTQKLPKKSQVSAFPLSKGKNGQAPVITLNSGYEMPVLGLGTYSLLEDECVNSVSEALKLGFRKIDTAYIYDNEESVGEGIRKSGVPREDVFVTTKLYMNQYANATKAIDDALKRLDVDYIDLMLLHHPGQNDEKAYKAMEKAVRQGKIRSIGLSNYYIEELEAFLPNVTITPALIQNEIHPYYQEKEVVDYLHGKGIAIEAWYPFGGRGYTGKLFQDETIASIAEKHNQSSAQIILRWHLQRGVVAIPGSSNPDHIQENISVFDFKLSQKEMEQIGALDRGEKHDWY